MANDSSDYIEISMRMSPKKAEKLEATGNLRQPRTQEQQKLRTQLYKDEAKPGRDVARFGDGVDGRVDAAGNIQVDGGILKSRWEGSGNIYPTNVITSLEKQGYFLFNVYILEKKRGGGDFLRLTFAKRSTHADLHPEIQINNGARLIVESVMGIVYKYYFPYFNERALVPDDDPNAIKLDGSISTHNLTYPIYDGKTVKELKAEKQIGYLTIIDEVGHFRCPRR